MAKKNAKRKVKIEQQPLWLLKYLAFGEIPEPKEEGCLDCFKLRGKRRNVKRMWKKYRNFILSDCLQYRPGTRPFAWWLFDAPRWNRQFGAWFDGYLPEPQYECLSVVPRFSFGVPVDWLEESFIRFFSEDFKGIPIDKDNPPMFESQAAYLQRYGLLKKSEEKRLSDSDFEPESCLKYIKTYKNESTKA